MIAEPRLHEQTLAGSVAFEIATRARQGGVPAYAVTGENLLDSFDARILDLQTIIEARDSSRAARRRTRAGRPRLATPRRGCTAVSPLGRLCARHTWQPGHQYVVRLSSPWPWLRTRVPQRSHGRPARL